MGNWVTLTELGERKCTAIKIQLSSANDIDDSGNYNFSREFGVQGSEWGSWGSNFRFDLTARNVCDYNINGGADTYYRDLNAETYQGEYNGKEYYITYDGEYVQWEWTEPVYYYGFSYGTGNFDPEPIAADFIYVMLEGADEPEKPITIADNLQRIIKAKAEIKTAIENKGVTVGDITIDGYANKIGEIPQGDVSFSGLDFSVIGYDMALTKELNDKFNADIQYSLQKYNNWNPNETYAPKVFQNDKKLVYAPLVDTHLTVSMFGMFQGCTNLKTVPLFNTSRVSSMYSMFDGCSNLTTVPLFDFSKMENTDRMFYNCTNLTTVPLFNTSKVLSMASMFRGCTSLTTVPQLDTSNATNISYLFHSCTSLRELPHLDTSKVTNVGSMLDGCTSLTEVPLFNFSNVTNISYFFGFSDLKNITTLGGFKDLKIDWNDNFGLADCPNLTYESVMNVINNLYDFRANGDETTTKTIKFHSNSLALLSDDDKAIATNRGWVLS